MTRTNSSNRPDSLSKISIPWARAPWLAVAITLTGVAAGCSSSDEAVIQLTSRLVSNGELGQFTAAHGAYSAVIAERPGVGDSRLFSSFFSSTASDVPAESFAVVELTVFDSEADYRDAVAAAASAKGQIDAVATTEADILVRQPDGSVDLADFDGASLEIAVRGIDPANRQPYDDAQTAFLGELTTIAGAKTVEFEMVQDGAITAGYSTYATQESLQETLDFYTGDPLAFDFFGSFDLVSSQFGSRITGVDAITASAQ